MKDENTIKNTFSFFILNITRLLKPNKNAIYILGLYIFFNALSYVFLFLFSYDAIMFELSKPFNLFNKYIILSDMMITLLAITLSINFISNRINLKLLPIFFLFWGLNYVPAIIPRASQPIIYNLLTPYHMVNLIITSFLIFFLIYTALLFYLKKYNYISNVFVVLCLIFSSQIIYQIFSWNQPLTKTIEKIFSVIILIIFSYYLHTNRYKEKQFIKPNKVLSLLLLIYSILTIYNAFSFLTFYNNIVLYIIDFILNITKSAIMIISAITYWNHEISFYSLTKHMK
jgi:hypothetical protein